MKDVATDLLLGHPLAKRVPGISKMAQSPLAPTRDQLLATQDAHNRKLFHTRALTWREELRNKATGERTHWWRHSASRTWLARLPINLPPHKRWSELADPALGKSPLDVAEQFRKGYNHTFIRDRKAELAVFFQTIERSPLTEQQIEAVVCFDDHELVVAAAGSGKTSTMVAKAGYAIVQGICQPEQVLLLAFNRKAAEELGERLQQRLAGVPKADAITAKTFHGFSMTVIAQATGAKPMLAPWLERDGQDIHQIADIIRSLESSDADFAHQWAEFRVIFAQDIGRWDLPEEPEDWDASTGARGFRTAQGEVVRSKEERTIANWLFHHGVRYVYEQPYEHPTADTEHRQYLPDFYFPDVGVYYEHFALDSKGHAPPHFEGYVASAQWKRDLHARLGTPLIETTSHELRSGLAFSKLRADLTKRGLDLVFDPNRAPNGKQHLDGAQLSRSFRVFQQHVKSNRLDHAALLHALEDAHDDAFKIRLKIYLSLFEKIANEWERRLRQGGYIDYEDMLNQAADLLDHGDFDSPYLVILADEFQDSSTARARLLKGLIKSAKEPAHLCVVGDDWQAINRFAGADISLMTRFTEHFGASETHMLTTTFRCPQDLCDASSQFVSANPAQIKKDVRTTNAKSTLSLYAFAAQTKEDLPGLIYEKLLELSLRSAQEQARPTVKLLGRYGKLDRPYELKSWIDEFSGTLDVSFSTVHSAKGLEADYVFLLNVVEGTLGFPCKIEDDPVLALAMPDADPFPFAEERRLFYVALTRARLETWIFTTTTNPSQFVVELQKNGRLSIEDSNKQSRDACPQCGKGVLVTRSSRYGPFLACSQFPACAYKESGGATGNASAPPGESCPKCREGRLVRRQSRFGPFLGCSRYPACDGKAQLPNRRHSS